MNDELAAFKRLNLKRHPILRAIYDAVQAIEECGASTKLTDAVCATTRLYEMAATLLDERDAARAEKARIILSANEAAAILGDQCEKMENKRDEVLALLAAASVYILLDDDRARRLKDSIDAVLQEGGNEHRRGQP